MENSELKWLGILEYATYKNKSISTVRRYLKSGRLKYQIIDGKYLIQTKVSIDKNTDLGFIQKTNNDATIAVKKELSNENSNLIEYLQAQNEFLKSKCLSMEEEISELKMLINIYENKNESNYPPEFNLSN